MILQLIKGKLSNSKGIQNLGDKKPQIRHVPNIGKKT